MNICGNSIAIIGFASADCDGGAVAYNGSSGSYSGAGSSNGCGNSYHRHRHHKNTNGSANAAGYDDRGGIGIGNQSSFTFQVPINVSCNSVALVGFASSCLNRLT
ncbi:hypothetical protein [Dactylosporangium sp. NPDC049140]|uniref:hypothetical protein n=1 Tax=Dactylosporangium sp. NPDC049140 TaxID=3155647 RepID=UPI0033CBA37F